MNFWEKIKTFLWLLAEGRLLTNHERERRHLTMDNRCPVCEEDDESTRHLFWDCMFARDVWRGTYAPEKFGFPHHMQTADWLKKNCDKKHWMADNPPWKAKFAFTLWGIWKARNEKVFRGATCSHLRVVQKVLAQVHEMKCLMTHSNERLASALWVGWAAPRSGWRKLNTDGSFKSTSGLASAGGLIRDDRGASEWGFTMKVGRANTFKKELWGLREGLRLCWEREVDKVIVEMDSKGVVDVMADPASREEGWGSLLEDCMFLASKLTNVKFNHVLREGNRCADLLTNLGHTSNRGTTVWDDPPDELMGLLLADAGGATTRRVK